MVVGLACIGFFHGLLIIKFSMQVFLKQIFQRIISLSTVLKIIT